MVHHSTIFIIAAPAVLLFSCVLSSAVLLDEASRSRFEALSNDLRKREDEDDTDVDIAADGTGPMRSALSARNAVFLQQATATWYQLDPGPSDAAASFTSFATTTPTVTPPPPSDPKQIQSAGNGDGWDVDHILELQILAGAFSAANGPTQIPAATYQAISNALFTKGPAVTAIAQKITVLDNLQAIPNRVNGFKKNVVRGNLTGKSYPGANTYYGFLGPGVQKYLTDAQGRLFGPGSVADQIGDELQSAGNNEAAVKDYFTSFASSHYQGAIDYLSTWSGLPYTRTTVLAAAATSPPLKPFPHFQPTL